jgi:hypothetical protein
VVPLLLDEGPILSHIVESLEYGLQGNLIFPGEFFGRERIKTMDRLIDHRRADPPTLEKQLKSVARTPGDFRDLVPTLGVGMPAGPLCGPHREGGRNIFGGKKTTPSVADGIPTPSVGTRAAAAVPCRYPGYSLGNRVISLFGS